MNLEARITENLIGHYVSLEALDTARIDPEWGYLEFNDGKVVNLKLYISLQLPAIIKKLHNRKTIRFFGYQLKAGQAVLASTIRQAHY